MRIHIIRQKAVENHISDHPDSVIYFKTWLDLIQAADWDTPDDILTTFGSASFLGNGSALIAFQITGSVWQLIAKYDFTKTRIHLTVGWIGTTSEFTKLFLNR